MTKLFLIFATLFGLVTPTPLPIVSPPIPTNTLVPTLLPKPKNFYFTSQAPNGDWENPVFQNGCEESAVLMLQCSINALCPVKNGIIDSHYAMSEIKRISDWEIQNYGSNTDTSAADTANRLLKSYYHFENFKLKNIANSNDLKTGIWIVPINGQILRNPHYTAPGPERHMILIIGYDPKTDELITNDAGTKYGKNYRYNIEHFYSAIRDYSTGDHQPIIGTSKIGILISL